MLAKEKVLDILKELSGKTQIGEEDSLLDDVGFDSLGMITLLVELEDQLLIQLDESDMDPLALVTVQDVICLVEKYEK